MTPEMARRAVSAYHEAGHAVVAHELGCTVSRVTIVPDPARPHVGGTCHFAWPRGPVAPHERAAVFLAGIEAERRARGLGRTSARALLSGEGCFGDASREDDLRRMRSLLLAMECGARIRAGGRQLSEEAREALRERYTSGAREFLADRAVWAAVERVALALFVCETLDGRELATLLDR